LFEASNGLFYGLSSGGTTSMGTLFSYDPVNNIFTVLHTFGGTDGSAPQGTLMQAADGKLYGVTSTGGTNNVGVLFHYDISSSTYTKLYDFAVATGSNPAGDLHQSANLVLYGSASNGGVSGMGALFSYDLGTGTYTDILDFNGTNGSDPTGGFAAV